MSTLFVLDSLRNSCQVCETYIELAAPETYLPLNLELRAEYARTILQSTGISTLQL